MSTPVTRSLTASVEDGAKRAIEGAHVTVLLHRRTERGMSLEPFAS